MEQASFYVRMFTRSGSMPDGAIAEAEALIREMSEIDPSLAIEPYEKLGLYANKVTLSVNVDQPTALALFDAFLAVAPTGGHSCRLTKSSRRMRRAGMKGGQTKPSLDSSVRGAFLGVERAP